MVFKKFTPHGPAKRAKLSAHLLFSVRTDNFSATKMCERRYYDNDHIVFHWYCV